MAAEYGSLEEAKLEQLRKLKQLRSEAAKVNRGVEKYYSDPVGFAHDCIDWRGHEGLTFYQDDILSQLQEKRRVSVRGPHGLGKSAISAITILWFSLTREASGVDWKAVTTAGAWRQLIQYLWPEIRKWANRLHWTMVRDHPFTGSELLNLSLRLRHGSAFAAAASNPALIEGAHADSLLFIYDESKAIAASTFDACEGAFSGTGESFAMALSTPGAPQGRFYDIQSRKPGYEDWHVRHVTLADAMAAGRISEEWAEQRRIQWGENTALFQNRVLGEFYAGEEDSIIPLSWVEAAIDRWHEWQEDGSIDPGAPHTLGVDIARSGADRTVLAVRQNNVITELRPYTSSDTMVTTGRVMGVLEADPTCTAIVDVVGVGGGVMDRLTELGAKTQAFNAAGKTRRRDRTGELGFVNCLTGDARIAPVGRLLRVYRSRYQGTLFEIEMASGDHFTATANHNVLTEFGWSPVQSLRVGDRLCDSSIRNSSNVPCTRPEIDDIPPTISDIYSAGHRLFGSKRVEAGAVDFHGDRPVGDVDVVTINSDLSMFRKNTANGTFMYSDGFTQSFDGFSSNVSMDNVNFIDNDSSFEFNRFGLAAWLDIAFAKNTHDDGPTDPEVLAKRAERISSQIPFDEIISINVRDASGHEDSFVYTLETSTGAYHSATVVHQNCRTASWYNLRELLDPSSGSNVCLPPNDDLLGDLTAPKSMEPLSGGKLKMESKDDLRKRIGRSTDFGDAVVQAFWTEAGNWHDAYGTLTCDGCARGFVLVLNGQRRKKCPYCNTKIAVEDFSSPENDD